MTVTFHRLAEQELIAAARHLATAANLGDAFLDEYEMWEARIVRHPFSCPEIVPNIRRGYLPRFKYHVTYSVCGKSLRILYVRYAKMAPLGVIRRT